MANQQTSLPRVTSETGLALRDGATPSTEDDGAHRQLVGRKRTSATNNLGEHAERWPPIAVTDGFSARRMCGACVASGAFALALRVPLTEFEDEMRKQGGRAHDRAGIVGVR